MRDALESVSFAHGPSSRNRLMLSPLTNQQSQVDGILSDEEYHWLTMRARGGFGVVSTCATHVHPRGQGFPGQLGCFSDDHVSGLTRLAAGIKEHGALAVAQLHHAGVRAPRELTGESPVAPYDDAESGAHALTTEEVEDVVTAFVTAAQRCQRAGFDGVELHGAHGYLLCEFLEVERNVRSDRYGGSFENRTRIFFDIISKIRATCGSDFHLSVRLSPERFSMTTADVMELFDALVATNEIDLIDLSLWDVFKEASDPFFAGRSLVELFTSRPRGETRLAAAGKLYSADEIQRALDAGLDIAVLGRAAITNHDFPRAMSQNPRVKMRPLPVSVRTLLDEGVSPAFITYLRNWEGFVED